MDPMPRFIQVGEHILNVQHIVRVEIVHGRIGLMPKIVVTMVSGDAIALEDWRLGSLLQLLHPET